MATAGGPGKGELLAGDLGGFDEGVIVNPVATGTVDKFTDKGFAHRILVAPR